MFKRIFAVALIILLIGTSAFAQSDEMVRVRVRVVNLVKDAPALALIVNGEALGVPIESIFVSDFYELAREDAVIGFAQETVAAPPLVETTLEGENGHDYALILRGSVEQGSVDVTVIDETAERAALDTETQAPLLFIHDLPNAPAVTLWVNDDVVLENVGYGDVMLAGLPVGAVESVVLTAAADQENVLLSPPFFIAFVPEVEWTLALFGTYPGEPRLDYRFLPIPAFLSEVSVTESGDIAVGTTVEGTLQVGERAAYTLNVEQETTFDIVLTSPDGMVDPYVGLFDMDGALVAENDELDDEDDVLDAGFQMLTLPPGTYTLIAGSFRDANAGMVQLSVTVAE